MGLFIHMKGQDAIPGPWLQPHPSYALQAFLESTSRWKIFLSLSLCVSVSSSLYHFQTNKWVFRGISLTHIALPITVCYLFLIPSPPFPVVRYFLLQMAISFISLPLKVPCLCVRFSHTGASALAWLRPTLASTQVSALLWAMWTAMSNTECYGGKDDLSSRNQEDANAAGSSVRKHIK